MTWWINVCDTPLDGNYQLAIAKGLFTIFFFCLITGVISYWVGLSKGKEDNQK